MGFGVITEQSTGYPGYNSVMTRDKATIGKILERQRLLDLLVRQEPQRADLDSNPRRSLRQLADCYRMRTVASAYVSCKRKRESIHCQWVREQV
jgi:hypothetical protein